MNIAAGFGDPPKPSTHTINASRIGTALDCEVRAWHTYRATGKGRVPAKPSPALSIGTVAHKVREGLSGADPDVDAIVADAVATLENAQAAATERGFDGTEYRRFAESLPDMVAHFVETDLAKVRVVAAEQPFWLSLSKYTVVGTFDAIFQMPDDRFCVGELKTMSDKTDIPSFFAWRKTHPQHVLYDLAGHVLYRHQYAGVRYEAWTKAYKPKRGTKEQTLEERLAAWPAKLFSAHTSFNEPDPDLALKYVGTGYNRIYERDRDQLTPNHNACMTYGKKACPFFDVCHRGYDVAGLEFEDREPDYVDRLREAAK